jgi:type I restriction enzyme S subunit
VELKTKAENTNKPLIRFNGYTSAWERRRLGDVALIIMGQSPNSTHYTDNPNDPILVQGNADMKNGRVTPRVWTTQVTKKAEKSDLILSVRAPVGDVGKTDYPVVLGRGVAAIRGNEFLYQMLLRMKQVGYWDKLSTGSTFDSINLNDIRESLITVPTTDEQNPIGDILGNLDHLITLHRREYDKTVNIKKAMLEKMFPKNGKDKPEIRFSGFAGAWEQRKLGQVADLIGGGTPSTNNSAYWGGDIDWYAPTEIGEQILVAGSQRKITELGLQKSSAKILPVGTVLFTSRAGIGNTAILTQAAATNQGFQSIVPHKDGVDSYFIFSKTDELKRYGETVGAGSTFVEVSGKQMAKMPIRVPSMSEQKKIGAFFSALDRLVTLHRRELVKLQNMKKALLEKMFV